MYAVGRAMWIIRYYGAKNVRILNGGLKKWIMEGRNTVSGEQIKKEAGDYTYEVTDTTPLIMDVKYMHQVAK